MRIARCSSFGLLAAWAALFAGLPAGPATADACAEKVTWSDAPGDRRFQLADACVTLKASKVSFQAMRFLPANVEIELVGSSPDGGAPNLSEITKVRRGRIPLANFFLSATHDRHPKFRALFPVGLAEFVTGLKYHEATDDWVAKNLDPDWINYAGYMRINGDAVSSRDFRATFKSVMFCVSSRDMVQKAQDGKGSVPVMFWAFDDGVPVDLNSRVKSRSNCPDVVQTGPRIIEYNSKPGIRQSTIPQDFLIFAQGAGGGPGSAKKDEFSVYVLYFRAPATLLEVQELMLKPFALSGSDRKMKYAFALTTGLFAGGSIRFPGLKQQWGKVDKPHPVFLGVR